MRPAHVLVLAKSPRPGRVKTRLCPPCTPDEAAAVAAAALADTLDAVTACGVPRRILALDGPPGPWLPPGFTVLPQRGATFNHRLANAWADAGGPGIQIGMDTPQVTSAELDALLAELDRPAPRPAVLGPALDGGWWVIGWRQADPETIFAGIPMSAATTGRVQESRLLAAGFDVTRAMPKRDVDTFDDLVGLAAEFPQLRTSATAREMPAALAGVAARNRSRSAPPDSGGLPRHAAVTDPGYAGSAAGGPAGTAVR